jgi:hypothetical protein
MQGERGDGKNGGWKCLVPDDRLLRADGRDHRPDCARLLECPLAANGQNETAKQRECDAMCMAS